MIGTKLAEFELTGHLGSGGMGDVYQVTDSKLGRSVAVTFLPEAFARDADRVARLRRVSRRQALPDDQSRPNHSRGIHAPAARHRPQLV